MRNPHKSFRYAWVAIVVLMGCVGEPVIPVSDLTSPRGRYAVRMVRPGDTLYVIAWEAGIDYRQLADWNGLAAPYSSYCSGSAGPVYESLYPRMT